MSDSIDTFNRIKSHIEIDPLCLDQELIELPMLMMDATEECARHLTVRDRAKTALDLAMAVAADDLRKQPLADAKGGVKQRSEAQIDTEVPLYENVQNAMTAFEDAKYELALWTALVDSLRAKRDAIKTFADLTISGYLSPNSALEQRKSDIRNASNGRRRITSQA